MKIMKSKEVTPMSKRSMSADEVRWRAEDNARALKQVAEMSTAEKNAATKILKDQRKSIDKVLTTKSTKTKSTKSTKSKSNCI